MKKENAKSILNLLHSMHPSAECELNFTSVFQLLVAVILSAQCTDKRVNIITEKLFKFYKTPNDFAYLDIDDLTPLIFSCGFYKNKGNNIIETSRILHEKYNDIVPKDMLILTTLPGIGRKTASVILSVGYGIQSMPVDTHVFRVSKRIGLTNSNTVVKVEKDLCELFEEDDWNLLHHSLIFHGRYICKALKPKCDSCLLKSECKYYKYQP